MKKSSQPTKSSKKAYALAGVDVDLGNSVKKGIQRVVADTHGPEVLGRIGGFGGLFRPNFHDLQDPVLVSSVDGVGTKLKIAFATGIHDTIGQDLVNHCINDIAVIGARPLFFLDYLAAEKLEPHVFTDILKGFAKACKAGGCAIIGGETAQMPGMYKRGEYDVAGCIVGVVDGSKMLDGSRVCEGDILLGIPSNGLHTNGYSLARKILLEQEKLPLDYRLPGCRLSLGAELLRVHKNYQPALAALPEGWLKAAAHITGGGLVDNLPRVLPSHLNANIDVNQWKVPAIFQFIAEKGKVAPLEMMQVFNMGIGMVVIVSPENAKETAKQLGAKQIGNISIGNQSVLFNL